MDVIRAETAGFCMGVDKALIKLDQIIAERGDGNGIYTLGPIIHNPQVLARYGENGVIVADSPDKVPAGAVCLIRAHGVPKAREAELGQRGVTIIDATCPRVKKAQLLIETETAKGRSLLLYGEADHPEVAGLLSYAVGETFVFGNLEELAAHALTPGSKYVLAAQTTQDKKIFARLAGEMEQNPTLDVTVLQTICDATKHRQAEAVALAGIVDHMVVVGGYTSGNTRRLAQVCTDAGTPCVHVETPQELPLDALRQAKTIGLTAGASTPADLIDAVEAMLKSL